MVVAGLAGCAATKGPDPFDAALTAAMVQMLVAPGDGYDVSRGGGSHGGARLPLAPSQILSAASEPAGREDGTPHDEFLKGGAR